MLACLPSQALHCSSSGLPVSTQEGFTAVLDVADELRMLHSLPAHLLARQHYTSSGHMGRCAAGRYLQPSRFSLNKSALRRAEGSAGAAEGPSPGKAAAAPLTALSLDVARAWHCCRWHGAILSPQVALCVTASVLFWSWLHQPHRSCHEQAVRAC